MNRKMNTTYIADRVPQIKTKPNKTWANLFCLSSDSEIKQDQQKRTEKLAFENDKQMSASKIRSQHKNITF